VFTYTLGFLFCLLLFTVPMDLDVKVKATLLGACFLIVSQLTMVLPLLPSFISLLLSLLKWEYSILQKNSLHH